MILAENIIQTVAQRHRCCSFWTIAVARLAVREKGFLNNFMPGAQTAVVVGHHVVTKEEWTWYSTANGGEHCAADDHTRDVCRQLKEALLVHSFSAKVVRPILARVASNFGL
jgi:hypothetical protein